MIPAFPLEATARASKVPLKFTSLHRPPLIRARNRRQKRGPFSQDRMRFATTAPMDSGNTMQVLDPGIGSTIMPLGNVMEPWSLVPAAHRSAMNGQTAAY